MQNSARQNERGVQVWFSAICGRLLHKVDSTGPALTQDLELAWEAIGNLTERHLFHIG